MTRPDGLLCLGVLGEELSAVELQLIGIERDVLKGLLDFDVHGDGALVRELAPKLDIMNAQGIVLWFDAERAIVLASNFRGNR